MSPRKKPAPPDAKPAGLGLKIGVGVLILVGAVGLLDGAWVGVLVGSIFVLIGLMVAFTFFGPYEGNPWSALFQAPGRLVLGGVMIFLGGLALVSAISDLRPSLAWNYPKFGDLRTLFWDPDDYRAMACKFAEYGPPKAIAYALERGGPGRVDCPRPDRSYDGLLAIADQPAEIEVILAARSYNQRDLDRKLVDLARRGGEFRHNLESLMEAGANPNVEIDYDTALSAALANHHLQLAQWLLGNGAQANFTFASGETLLERAKGVDRADLRRPYEELLLSRGAAESPKLEQPAKGR